MSREPAKPLPKGIVIARQLVNELANESLIAITATNPYWSETKIISKPFETLVSYDRENIELRIAIKVGSIFDSSAANDLYEMIPIPINLDFSLEPHPVLSVVESLAVTPGTTKNEIYSFINTCFVKSLMVVQTLLVTDGYILEDKQRWEASVLPVAQSLWDFGGLTVQILTPHGK